MSQAAMSMASKAVVAAVIAMFGLILTVVVVLAPSSTANAGGLCTVLNSTGTGAPGSTGPGLAGLDQEATGNARVVAAVVAARHLGVRAVLISEMTALTESGLHNDNFGDTAGPDSRGIFEQRDSWGPLAVRMDPAGATGLFLDRLVNIAGWASIAPWLAAQQVQVSAFDGHPRPDNHYSSVIGGNYKANAARAAAITTAVAGDPGVLMDCTSSGTAATGPIPVPLPSLPAAPAPYTGPAAGGPCDVPDGGGCIREVTAHGLGEIRKGLGPLIRSIGCYSNRPGDHGTGVACDLMVTTGQAATGTDLVNGWEIAAWLRANASALHVAYLIWQVRIWDARHTGTDDSGGWGQPYSGCSYCPSIIGNPSAAHTNHVHVSFLSPVTE
ncbi:MAG: hypothetical protein ABI418_15545 [Jatrophihabitantaceae bacterium]